MSVDPSRLHALQLAQLVEIDREVKKRSLRLLIYVRMHE